MPITILSPLKETDDPAQENFDEMDGGDMINDVAPPADVPVVVGTIIFVYSIYFIYLALFTDEVLDPRIPLAL